MKFTPTAKRRLLLLCRFMEKLPKKMESHFAMGTWFGHDNDDHSHAFEEGATVQRKDLGRCGTVACALGWAAAVPELQKIGLAMRFDEYGNADFTFKGGPEVDPYDAAMHTFDISRGTAVNLFSAIGFCAMSRTPKAWAKNARLLMRQQRTR